MLHLVVFATIEYEKGVSLIYAKLSVDTFNGMNIDYYGIDWYRKQKSRNELTRKDKTHEIWLLVFQMVAIGVTTPQSWVFLGYRVK